MSHVPVQTGNYTIWTIALFWTGSIRALCIAVLVLYCNRGLPVCAFKWVLLAGISLVDAGIVVLLLVTVTFMTLMVRFCMTIVFFLCSLGDLECTMCSS